MHDRVPYVNNPYHLVFRCDQCNRLLRRSIPLHVVEPIVEVALSAQELIDCVGKEHGVTGKVCDGLPLAWAFDYVYENGIAYREFYHHTNKEEECMINKYHIAGYEKPSVYNKLGLFDLVMRGP